MARIPVESTILVHGHVRLRPEKQRRPVITRRVPLGTQAIDPPFGFLLRARLVISRFL
jgi:hypothetical protein